MEIGVVPVVDAVQESLFDGACSRLRSRLKAIAARSVGGQEADDVVQQALLCAWAVRNRLNWNAPDDEILAWLGKFVIFTAREQVRTSSRRRSREAVPDTVPLPDDYLQLNVPDTTSAGNELFLLERLELVRLLRGARLTGRQRECVCSWANGESQHAIARRLNLRSATVWQHIEAAVLRMRQMDRDASYTAKALYFQDQGRRGYAAPEPVGARLAREQLAQMAHHDSIVTARCRRRRYRIGVTQSQPVRLNGGPKVAGSRRFATRRTSGS